MKRRGDKIVMVTAYDAPSGRLADAAGVDLDPRRRLRRRWSCTATSRPCRCRSTRSLFMTRAVTRGAQRPLVVADMPFGSYEVSDEQAVRNAVRLVKEGGADAVKLEGGGSTVVARAGDRRRGHPGDGPRRPDAAVGDRRSAASRRRAGRPSGRSSWSRTRSRSRRRAASRSCSRRCRPPVAARRDARARDPDDRHRRRRRDRRAGARLARHARLLRGPRAALRQALRGARRRDRRGARARTPRRSAAARSRRSGTRTRCRRRSWPRSRARRTKASWPSSEHDEQPAARARARRSPSARPQLQPCTLRTPSTSRRPPTARSATCEHAERASRGP